MKRAIKYILSILAIGFFSCENYLDSVPYSFTSPENFYSTPAEAEVALNGVYSVMSTTSINGTGNLSTFGSRLLFILNCGTDETAWDQGIGDATYSSIGNGAVSSNHEYINDYWYFFYSGINRANYLLEKLDGIDGLSDQRRIEIEGQTRVLRGMYHMYLSMLHGAIPTYATSDQDPNKARQPLNEVYELIISDFQFGYDNLPHRDPLAGRINKWSAAGFLAKAYTYLASAKTTGVSDFGYSPNRFSWVDAQDYYKKALAITSDIDDNSGYELIAEYDRLFRETTKADQARECLFMVQFSNDPTVGAINQLNQAWLPAGNWKTVGGSWGWCRPTGEMYDKYLKGDIRGIHNLGGFIPGNRKGPTLTIDGALYFEPNPLPSKNVGAMSIGKFRAKDPQSKSIPQWATETNISLVRLADIILLKAEAQYYTGEEAAARITLEKIRNRAAGDGSVVTADDLTTTYYNPDFLEELLEERSRELGFELWRRIDLARFNKFEEKIMALDPSNGYYNAYASQVQSNWKPERIWYPIPIRQRDLNPNLEQNPGY